MLRAGKRISRTTLQQSLRPPQPRTVYLSFLYPTQAQWIHSRAESSRRPSVPATQLPSGARTATTSKTFDINENDIQLLSGAWTDGKGTEVQKTGDALTQSLLILNQPKHNSGSNLAIRGSSSRDKTDLLATYDACLHVGRIARAQLMLTSMGKILIDQKDVLLTAHNSYLRALLRRAESDGTPENLEIIFTWHDDVMVKELKLSTDATTVSLLLKGCLQLDQPVKVSRNVMKYVAAWVEQPDNSVNDIFKLDILTPKEVVSVAKICSLHPEDLDEKYRDLYVAEEPNSVVPITGIPEAQQVQSKGLGLASVKQSLKSLIDPDSMPRRHMYGEDDMAFQIARQKLLEDDAFISAQDVWKAEHEELAAKGFVSLSDNINNMLWQWHQALVPLIKQEVDRVQQAEKNPGISNASDRILYGPFLCVMSPEKIASIVILEMIKGQNSSAGDGMKTSVAVVQVGEALEQEYYAEEISKKKNRDLFGEFGKDELNEMFKNPKQLRITMKRTHKRLEEQGNDPNYNLLVKWPATVIAKLGAVLISMLLHCAKISLAKESSKSGKMATEFLPAVYHSYDYLRGRRIGLLKLHPELQKKLASEPLRCGVTGRLLPMLVPPRPWITHDDGGYFYSKVRVMRTKFSKEQEIYIQAASERGNLEKVFEGLDVLGQTAWKVNRKVFDIILQVWNTGEEFADVPPVELNEGMPVEPPPDPNPAVRIKWLRACREFTQNTRNNHSQRSGINLKIEIARAFLFERFYFPHNLDFRGRAYPIPPHLNHIGNDLSRGMLMFEKAKELGPEGLNWLKVHLANVSGNDKASFEDRIKFAEDHVEDIYDSALHPLDGKRWWLQSDDPWQCLAACMALQEALSSPDPTKYPCHLPVAMDGTCNGLQHYAALGGDIVGAKQVNLEPSEKPQDVYMGVANLVNIQVDKDAAAGDPRALLLQGHISRKVVKQSVMTNVYGVTFMGARVQIQNRLKEIPALPQEKHAALATYITRLVFDSISKIFTGATAIQNWLALSAKLISRSVNPEHLEKLRDPNTKNSAVEFMTSVVWTTPLHMPIVQPYRKERLQSIRTNLQRVFITDPSAIEEVHSRKQRTAFPPNFIHSLDATHMLMSATKSAENGLTFASVHDSFWTHPSDTPVLNRLLREAFVELHTENLMEKLKSEFETRYKHYRYLTTITFSTSQRELLTDLRDKYKATIGKQGLTIADELQWECDRDARMRSDDPEVRAKAEAEITPSVLVKSWGKDKLDHIVEVAGSESDATATEPKAAVAEASEDAEIEDNDDAELVEADDDDFLSFAKESDEAEEKEVEGVEEVEEVEEGEEGEGEAGLMQQIVEGRDRKASYRTARPQVKLSRSCYIWLPLEFPPLPEKGDFDVNRLKESKYFFS